MLLSRFCHLCETVKAEETTIQKFITNEGSEQCSTEETQQTLSFKVFRENLKSFQMCTPTKKELLKENSEHEGKLHEYWNYLKQVSHPAPRFSSGSPHSSRARD